MSAALCRATSCRPADAGGPREVEPHRPLCRVCAERLGPNLRRLAEMWPDLRERVAVEGRAGEKVTGTKLPGIVINAQVSDLSAEVAGWVRQLAATVLDAHKAAQRPAVGDTATLLAWLSRFHAWRLAYSDDHDFAVGVVDWVAWYRGEVRRVAYPTGARRVDIPGAWCRTLVDTDDGGRRECGGPLFAIVRDDASLLPSELLCDLDGEHRIPSRQWVQYARALEKANNAGKPE